jgi:hypothetical protein
MDPYLFTNGAKQSWKRMVLYLLKQS